MFNYNSHEVLCVKYHIRKCYDGTKRVDWHGERTFLWILPFFLHLLSFALMYPPLLPVPPTPYSSSPFLAQLPKTHGVLVGSVLPRKTSDSCCVWECMRTRLCLCVFALSRRRGLAPYVGPHLLAGEDYELQALIKTGFVYSPACTQRQQKQYDPSVAGTPPGCEKGLCEHSERGVE